MKDPDYQFPEVPGNLRGTMMQWLLASFARRTAALNGCTAPGIEYQQIKGCRLCASGQLRMLRNMARYLSCAAAPDQVDMLDAGSGKAKRAALGLDHHHAAQRAAGLGLVAHVRKLASDIPLVSGNGMCPRRMGLDQHLMSRPMGCSHMYHAAALCTWPALGWFTTHNTEHLKHARLPAHCRPYTFSRLGWGGAAITVGVVACEPLPWTLHCCKLPCRQPGQVLKRAPLLPAASADPPAVGTRCPSTNENTVHTGTMQAPRCTAAA